MLRLRIHICLVICLLFPHFLWAEGQTNQAVNPTDLQREDYITASLLVATPTSDVYSLFGHTLLRLNCPSKQMDYCFSFETSTETENLFNFLRGTAKGGYKAMKTDNLLEAYRQVGRGVVEYPLNLTPVEKITLWKNVDERIAKGFVWQYGYMHTQCTSMIIDLVSQSLSAPIDYTSRGDIKGSFREHMLTESEPFPWSAFFWQTIMGPEGDNTEPFEQTLSPRLLITAWQQANVGDARRLIESQGSQLIAPAVYETPSPITSPTWAFALFLIIILCVTFGQFHRDWQRIPLVVDILLIVLYTLFALFLTWLVLFSQQDGTQWNWYLVAFNPLPILLWVFCPKCRAAICRILAFVFLALIALTPLIHQLDLAHTAMMTPFAVRLAAYLKK